VEAEHLTGPPCARIQREQELPAALAGFGVSSGRPVLVLVGGAGGMSAADCADLETVFRDWLLPVLERLGAAVVDGATDTGVMRVSGRARRDTGAVFPLIGVAAAGTVRLPDRPQDIGAELEPDHTGVVVVPGTSWGDESPWLAMVARHLAGASPSVTLVVNGGEITFQDIANSIADRRPVIVVDGTGRTADLIARATADPTATPDDDLRPAAIAASSLVQVISLADPAVLAAAVESSLTR
jgi:hypothetical protein